MQQAISFITLGVADLARSRAFYRSLGWQESSLSEEAIAFYQVGSLALALFPRAALAEDAGVASAGNGFAGFTLAHNVADEAAVGRTLEEAVAAGARLVLAPEKTVWGGFHGYFSDPDGYLWEVCHNPFVTLTAEGHVQLPA